MSHSPSPAGTLVIFDCDGVLVDSEVIALAVLSEVMGEYGHPMDVFACRDAFMGRHSEDIVRGMEQRIGRALPGESVRLRARMLDGLRLALRPVAGAADMLARLPGARCVASSSDPARIRLTLELTALLPFFDEPHIFSGTEVARGKPAPDIFYHAASSMGFDPSKCVVVEDSDLGVRAGVAAGMRVVGFTGGSHSDPGHEARLRAAGADTVIGTLDRLPSLLDERVLL